MPSISWLRTVMDSVVVRDDPAVRVVGPGGLRRLDGLSDDVEHADDILPMVSRSEPRSAEAYPSPVVLREPGPAKPITAWP